MAEALHHVRTGSGDPVLLIPGLGGTVASWTPLIERLAPEREVVAVDMPGFGRSPALSDGNPPSARNLAAAIIDFWDSLGIGADPVVCGQSLGAWTGIEVARAGRARAVIALCPAGFWREPMGARSNPAHKVARAIGPLVGVLTRIGRVRDAALSSQIVHTERVSPAEAAELIRGYGRGSAYDEANALMRGNVVGDLADVEVPVTIAWAERDRLVRSKPLKPGILPDAVRQVVLPDAGHLPTWDQPELVAELVLKAAGDRLAA